MAMTALFVTAISALYSIIRRLILYPLKVHDLSGGKYIFVETLHATSLQ